MAKIKFVHGGKTFDEKYPEGIPTLVDIVTEKAKISSGLVMFPSGHASNSTCNLKSILENKNNTLLAYAINNDTDKKQLLDRLNNIDQLSNKELENIYNCTINYAPNSVDEESFDVSKFAK
jgi:2-methylcitrate dehydratase